MSIRPIDLQVIVPKAQTNPAAREHVVHKEAMQLQQTQMENKREATLKDKKVNSLAHKDGGKIEKKKDMTKEEEKKKKKKKQMASKEQTDALKEDDTQNLKKPEPKGWNFHRFDMKV